MPLPIVEATEYSTRQERMPNLPFELLSVGKAFIVPATFATRYPYVRTMASRYARTHNVHIKTVQLLDGSLQVYMPNDGPESFTITDSIKPDRRITNQVPNKEQLLGYLRIMEPGSSFEFKDVSRFDEFSEWIKEVEGVEMDCKLIIRRL